MCEPDPIVLPSALKWGILEDDVLHALRHHLRWFAQRDDMAMYIGPSHDGSMLEVGVIAWHGTVAVAHAMPARDKYLR